MSLLKLCEARKATQIKQVGETFTNLEMNKAFKDDNTIQNLALKMILAKDSDS